MPMVIALAKGDSQAANVMNANQKSLVTNAMHAHQITSIIRHVKVCLNNCFLKSHPNPSVSECGCNSDGSTSLQCDANGNCTCKDGFGGKQCDVCKEEGFTGSKCDECKPNVIGDKCDECQPNYFNYPSCQGL